MNIPFRVFAFSDDPTAATIIPRGNSKNIMKFSRKEGELNFGSTSFNALELLSSTMNINQYNFAQKQLLFIGDCYDKNRWHHSSVPANLHLNGTPLDESIIFAAHYLPVFKETHRLDIVNAIFLTDGESNMTDAVIENGVSRNLNSKYGIYSRGLCNTVITDKKTGHIGRSKGLQPITVALIDLAKKMTGANIVGYYMIESRSRSALNYFLSRNGVDMDQERANTLMKNDKIGRAHV